MAAENANRSAGADGAVGGDPRAEELAEVIREIQERVRSRYPTMSAPPYGVPLPDLLPLLHARDAADSKVASIGSVNPRPGGVLNRVIQAVKRTVARLLDWHIREQVTFNRAVLACVESTLEALNESNRAFQQLSARVAEAFDQLRASTSDQLAAMRELLARLERISLELRDEASELKDVRKHWAEWRVEWERKLSINEVQFLRSVADLQSGFQHRVTLMDADYRESMSIQHREFNVALEKGIVDVQRRLWDDMQRVRVEYERLIHNELRVARQRLGAIAGAGAAAPPPVAATTTSPATTGAVAPPPAFDYGRFADRFRGTTDYVRERLRIYVPYFAGCTDILDIGCGRGEFLDLMADGQAPPDAAGARRRVTGIDLGAEEVALCRSKGHHAELADLFTYLAEATPPESLDGIFCAQVIEHLAPSRIPEMIRLAAASLRTGGVLVIETPNPECLAIFSSHFYMDPTHTRPVPPALLHFYLEEAGFGTIERRTLSPAVDSMPALAELPERFRGGFFDGLDYALIARRL